VRCAWSCCWLFRLVDVVLNASGSHTEDSLTLKLLFGVHCVCGPGFRESIAPSNRLDRGFCNAGTCVAVVLVCGPTVVFVNLGDSRAIATAMRTSAIPSDAGASGHDTFVELTTAQVTFDHLASDADEAELVRRQSGDPQAIRCIAGEALPRVAASLAVTRSFGDFYLKYPEFCPQDAMKSHLPYLLPNAFSSWGRLFPRRPPGACQTFVVVASDGLWDHLTNDQVGECVGKHVAQHGPAKNALEAETVSDALLFLLLQTVAAKRGLSVPQLLQSPPGRRRQLFDDITITVLFMEGALSCAGSNSTSSSDSVGPNSTR
jgi:pyruvate dehydrogenase phosphatase